MLERDSEGHVNIARRGLLSRLHRSKQRVALSFVLAMSVFASVPGMASVELRHVHALGYSADGKRLLVPDHSGIAVYEAGRWSKLPGPPHDYLGFAVTHDSIVTSGHMAGSRGLANPLDPAAQPPAAAPGRRSALAPTWNFTWSQPGTSAT